MAIKHGILLLCALLLGACSAYPDKEAAGQIDVKGLVLSHLGDSYVWELPGGVEMPLPVIVRSSDGKWHTFLSSRLEHGAEYKGFAIAAEGDYSGKIVENGRRPPDFSLTRNALAILFNCTVVLLLVMPLARWYRRGRMDAPGGLRGVVELVACYMRDEVIEPCLGAESRRYEPLLLTLFFFILVSNLMGLVPFFPGGANVTGNIAVTGVLALVTMLVVNFSGTRGYWKEIFWPQVPTWLKVPAPIMPVIELVGVFTKPFALMIRLFANIFAGHAVLLGLVCVVFITVKMGPEVNRAMSIVAVAFSVFMLCLELLVAFIQAYVFTLLSAVFIGMARVKHESAAGHSE